MAYQKIDALTSLRFFAAAAIVAYHASGHFGLSQDVFKPFELCQGVSFFFVLSGFILAYVYPKLESNASTLKFWTARFARIWPLHVATMLLYICLLHEYIHWDAWSIPTTLANIALLQAWIPNSAVFFSLNTVSWSISTEAFFYLSFPFLIRNFDKTWGLKLALSFILMICMATASELCHLPAFCQNGASIHGMVYINPLSRLFEFVLGMSVAHLYRNYLLKREAPLRFALGIEVIALSAVYLLTLNTAKIAYWVYRTHLVGDGGRMWLLFSGVPVLSFALLIAVIAWGRGPIARLLSKKPLVVLGEISFATYLVHRLLLHYYWNHFAPEHGPLPIAVYLAVLLAMSYVLWSLVEVPCRQLIVRPKSAMARPAPSAMLTPGLALTFIFATLYGVWSGPPLERISLDTLNKTITEPCKVAFGNDLVLHSSKVNKTDKGINLTLYWQSLRKHKVKNFIAMQLLSEDNTLVRLKDFRQSLKEEVVGKGECFKNELFLPNSDLKYVHSLAWSLSSASGDAPKARLINAEEDSEKLYNEVLYEGMVAVKLQPKSVAAKSIKPPL